MLAQQLTTPPNTPLIIFTTAYKQYALDAFGVDAVDYLLKPISREKRQASLNMNALEQPTEEIILRQSNELLRLSL